MTAITTKFSALVGESSSTQLATISAGCCFWGIEHIYRNHFKDKALIDTSVGYTWGSTSDPTYKEVCISCTNHAEACKSRMTRIVFHRQGADAGIQCRSAIFTHNEDQRKIAEAVKSRYQKTFWNDKIVTEILPIDNWWDTESYHQKYLEAKKGGYECPTHFVPTNLQWLKDL